MAFDTLSQVCFKLAGEHALPVEANLGWVLRVFNHPFAYGAVCGYLGAFFTWMTLLRHAPVGPAFAASHLHVVSVMALSAWLFGEPITVMRVVGALLVVAGILCLGAAETQGDTAREAA
jgi:drug/metabolite transporter (DMT)-like permease